MGFLSIISMNEKVIVKMIFGSHLYGTNTPDSDTDYKGIFLPTKEQIYLGKIPKSHNRNRKKSEGEKNNAGDVDVEIYSLHYFIKLACDGQTVAFDMLHAPSEMIINSSPIWDDIVYNREKFYSKNLKAFVGYARGQAARYGVKGSRLIAVGDVLDVLYSHAPELPISCLWSKLPLGKYCYMVDNNPQGIPQYQVCGKIFQATAKIDYVQNILQKFYDNYGKRAKLAAKSKGVDWKAISHALRVVYQVRQLLIENTITFPLREAEFLKRVKLGQLDYVTEIAPKLEALMDEVEVLSENSKLPNKVDREFWNNFIMDVVGRNIC